MIGPFHHAPLWFVQHDPETGVVMQTGYMQPDAIAAARAAGWHVITRDIDQGHPALIVVDPAIGTIHDAPEPVAPDTRAQDIAEIVRRELAATDFTQVLDAPASIAAKREAWAAYRQSLRDLSRVDIDLRLGAAPLRPDGTSAFPPLK